MEANAVPRPEPAAERAATLPETSVEANAIPRPEPAAERAARMMLGLEWLMLPVILALAFMLASFAVRNSDFWMHLATGRLIAEGNYEFGKDPFSFATEGRTWVNHAWLFD